MITREKIFQYIEKNKRVAPVELMDEFLISRAMVHRHLKRLLEDNLIEKEGSPPRVFYAINETRKNNNFEKNIFSSKEKEILENNFLYITPVGKRMVGEDGFIYWCQERFLDPKKEIKKYLKIIEKYKKLKKNNFYDASSKLKTSFKKICADKLFYIDFNSIEIFGKTKLGQMLLYAKQGQDRKEMRKISLEIGEKIKEFIEKNKIDSIVFVPPTVKRQYQFMKFLERELKIKLPKIEVIKKNNEVIVPQKTLRKLSDRQKNAEATFEVLGNGNFNKTLIIDDAVGSGATINEIACKIKEKKISKKVLGISIVGSLNGFEIVSEV